MEYQGEGGGSGGGAFGIDRVVLFGYIISRRSNIWPKFGSLAVICNLQFATGPLLKNEVC